MHQSIRHYMTPDPRTIAPDESLHKARQVMQACGIRHLPVVEQVADGGERLVGIVTMRDMRLLEGVGAGGPQPTVREAMTPEPFVVSPNAPMHLVARTMAERKYGSAIVLDGGKVVGIFCAIDALNALSGMFREIYAAPTSDRWGRVVPDRLEP